MPCNGNCNQGRECICECKKETKMAKHKWHKEIKAWADGAEIEYRAVPGYGEWKLGGDCVMWVEIAEYRIKPQPKQPKYLYVWQELNYGKAFITAISNHSCAAAGHVYVGKIEVQDD